MKTKDILLGAALALAGVGSFAQEDPAVEAFAQWEARGQVFPTGPEEATFVGVLAGVIYVKDFGSELGAAAIDAGVIQCPGTLVINSRDGSQHGTGKCVVLTPDGERIFGDFVCTGAYLEGCQGEFKLTGGTGGLQGITGGGALELQSGFIEYLSTTPGSIVQQSAVGLAVWPRLTYTLPRASAD
jgi:hypothetical protein